MPPRYVLDTNIWAALLRHETATIEKMTAAANNGCQFLICPVVFYEVLRGLRHRDAEKQMQRFLGYANAMLWADFNRTDWQDAARLWANLRGQGRQISDADLLIGVYTVNRQAILVTDNEKDFAALDLQRQNWRT